MSIFLFCCSLHNDINVIAGPSSTDLASRIAKSMDIELTIPDVRIFSDGESKIKFQTMASRHCIIVQSTYPPIDRHLLQTFLMIKKCKDDGARSVCAVIPYLGYARQDREFLQGEAISISTIAYILQSCGLDHLITVDIHSMLALSHFRIKAENISSIPLFATYLKSLKLENPLVVSPDTGGAKRASDLAELLGTQSLVLKKKRDRNSGIVSIDNRIDLDVSSRNIVIIDDMISSGSSIVKACEVLKDKGAEKIFAMCTHALLLDDAEKKILGSGANDIISTNSIPGKYAKIDLSSLIAHYIRAVTYARK